MSREVDGVIRLQLVSPGSALLWQDVGGPLVCAGAQTAGTRTLGFESGVSKNFFSFDPTVGNIP